MKPYKKLFNNVVAYKIESANDLSAAMADVEKDIKSDIYHEGDVYLEHQPIIPCSSKLPQFVLFEPLRERYTFVEQEEDLYRVSRSLSSYPIDGNESVEYFMFSFSHESKQYCIFWPEDLYPDDINAVYKMIGVESVFTGNGIELGYAHDPITLQASLSVGGVESYVIDKQLVSKYVKDYNELKPELLLQYLTLDDQDLNEIPLINTILEKISSENPNPVDIDFIDGTYGELDAMYHTIEDELTEFDELHFLTTEQPYWDEGDVYHYPTMYILCGKEYLKLSVYHVTRKFILLNINSRRPKPFLGRFKLTGDNIVWRSDLYNSTKNDESAQLPLKEALIEIMTLAWKGVGSNPPPATYLHI